jgi:hypothetical protein
VASLSIKTIVETGIHQGKTTRAFSDMVAEVVTIEIDQNFWEVAGHLELLGNVTVSWEIHGSSTNWMRLLEPG